MRAEPQVPLWLWRWTTLGLTTLLVGLALLAAVLALGAADPPRAGPLLWQDDFKRGLARWETRAPPGGRLWAPAGALILDWRRAAGPAAQAWAVTPEPAGDYTLEVAGASATAVYGLVFGWRDPSHYHAVVLNGSGYVEAYTQHGGERVAWFAWQQWPHILAGAESNRVRIDVRGSAVTARVNDEVLATVTLADTTGGIGVLAAAEAPARAVFSWVRVWARP